MPGDDLRPWERPFGDPLRVDRDFEHAPYDRQEQRVANYLSQFGVGGGDAPVGFLLASHELLRLEALDARNELPELRRFRETRPDVLWCCHVRGPDDVYAAPDYDTALKWADATNTLNWRELGGTTRPVETSDDMIIRAVPAPWPHSAEEHAKALPGAIAGMTPPTARPDPIR